MKKLVLTSLTALLLAQPVLATEYTQLDSHASELEFQYQQMGVKLNGQFRRYEAQLKFDPAHPEQASVQFQVDLSSIDTGSPEANGEVAGKDWFNLAQYATARFNSRSVKALGGQRYEVTGPLTLKGQSRDVKAVFSFKESAGKAQFDGTFTLKRLEFGIGSGSWGDTSIVADPVEVRFHLVANPRKP